MEKFREKIWNFDGGNANEIVRRWQISCLAGFFFCISRFPSFVFLNSLFVVFLNPHHSCLLPLELVREAYRDDLQRNSFVCLSSNDSCCSYIWTQVKFLHLKQFQVTLIQGFEIISHRFVVVDLADFWHRQLEVHSEGLAFSWGGNVNNPISIWNPHKTEEEYRNVQISIKQPNICQFHFYSCSCRQLRSQSKLPVWSFTSNHLVNLKF